MTDRKAQKREGRDEMATTTQTIKTEKAIEILTTKLGVAWSANLQDAVEARVRTCDGKDTPTQIARWVARQIAA